MNGMYIVNLLSKKAIQIRHSTTCVFSLIGFRYYFYPILYTKKYIVKVTIKQCYFITFCGFNTKIINFSWRLHK